MPIPRACRQASRFGFITKATRSSEGVLAEMIYWERPQGGRVFNAGAIGAGWAFSADPKFQALMRKVLHAFAVRQAQRQKA